MLQATTPKPKPARKRAYIESAGFPIVVEKDDDGKITKVIESTYTHHVYVRTELQPCPQNGPLQPQWAHIFKCYNTGAERVFGVEDATRITSMMQRNETSGLPS